VTGCRFHVESHKLANVDVGVDCRQEAGMEYCRDQRLCQNQAREPDCHGRTMCSMKAGLIGNYGRRFYNKLKRERKREKRGKKNIVGNMGDLATAVGQGFYVADAWGGGTCSAMGSATAAVTQIRC
jgi:hypothetical protein